jgi:hypothetical protein
MEVFREIELQQGKINLRFDDFTAVRIHCRITDVSEEHITY